MHAATITGQVRSLLRQTTLDAACSVLPTETGGTLVHARLDPVDGSPHWTLT
ncbi:hypothetical protein [Streptomyces lavendulae]|uniref:hypothetical protein n=1 Tax=Streptomyces lavendulae TaxID=1914 RepID=UPI0031EB3A01